jgi:GNAT superfamily N-acetyltransferase
VRVREATRDDLDVLVGLLEEVQKAFGERSVPAPRLRAWTDAALASGTPAFLIAGEAEGQGDGDGGMGVASVALVPTTHRAGTFAFVDDVYVRPASRRRGVATALLREAVRFARRAGATELRLAADMEQPASRELYRAAGFTARATWLVRDLPAAEPSS